MATKSEQAGPRKDALIVLGMHRSGTSAMARVMSLAGATLPSVLMEPGPANVDGHWEPQEVANLNDQIFAGLDSSWSDTFGPRDIRIRPPPTERFVADAREILRRNYGDESCIVFKEPRISIFLDLWKTALREEGYRVGFVIMVRHPLEVAESLKARDGFIKDKSLFLWATYMLSAELGTREEKRLFVKFDDLIANPEAVLDRVEANLDVRLPRRTWESTLEIQDYLKLEHKHHSLGDAGLQVSRLAGIETLYGYLDAACRGEPRNADVVDEVSDWLVSIEQTAGGLLKDEERKRRAAESEIQKLTNLRDALESALLSGEDERRTREAAASSRIAQMSERAEAAEASARQTQEQLSETSAALLAAQEQLGGLEAARRRIAALEAEAAEARKALDEANARHHADKTILERVHQNKVMETEEALHAARAAHAADVADLSARLAEADGRVDIARVRADALAVALASADGERQAGIVALETERRRAATELQAAHDQSSELARELTAVIGDRDQLRRFSIIELQLAVLRRFWPRSR